MRPTLTVVSAFLVVLMLVLGSYSNPDLGHESLKRALSPRVEFTNYPFVALIMATNVDGIVEYVCSGSVLTKSPMAHILTTAYCIQDRDDSSGRKVTYTVLLQDDNGPINLGLFNFTQYGVRQRFFHPNSSETGNFNFVSRWPNGTEIGFSVAVNPYDIGILRLNNTIGISAVKPVELAKSNPAPGSNAVFAGYGGPQFFTLGATTGTQILQSTEVVNGQEQPNQKIIFIHDLRSGIEQDQTQAVEPGDEGSPILISGNQQVGVVQGSWQVNTEETGLVTFATLGTSVPENNKWITTIINEKPTTKSDGMAMMPTLALLACLVAFLNFF